MSVLAFSKEDVLAIHASAIERFGGLDGLRDEGLLDSALAQPLQTFGGANLYPSAIDRACRCAFGIISDPRFSMATREQAPPCSAHTSGCLALASGLTTQPSSRSC
ncbi:type II toxin-antitoxin system death-on-curing family toxin [Olsenella uli]|uniref:type II toxin-antitoxin system death-on-curing family toxin n=1 Tax=Olsenella uli TaxID=133926 RepID=UPI0038991B5C